MDGHCSLSLVSVALLRDLSDSGTNLAALRQWVLLPPRFMTALGAFFLTETPRIYRPVTCAPRSAK